jgi:hypothetical protein
MGRAAAYESRHPEHSLLYSVIAEHLETLLVRQAERERPVPGFVERRRLRSCQWSVSRVLKVRDPGSRLSSSALRCMRHGPAPALFVLSAQFMLDPAAESDMKAGS